MKIIASFLFLVASLTSVIGQNVEYSTVYLKIYYQGNIIKYDKSGVSKSPIVYMPDGNIFFLMDNTEPDNQKEFTSLNSILNYMAIQGWILKTSNTFPYEGDSGNTHKSDILNTNEYVNILIFERPRK